ncbi:glycosyltransferase [Cupriavidus numazuensis]|uniref:Glycosyltransferase subfamily 4-like N-terminal domain-containing protein n=1 Tax=Cupriavidus numazuensis TaxID=221992 RepID=A0ABM8TF48_9BURK|nr:glycosyltransferase [Cupriavidus numazuensis]CAG2141818.1 hypothetical protein LMG26411_02124 [Cupriavidus numazuensis]
MKIIILAPFCSLPGEANFNRFRYLARLAAQHHEVVLVTSRFRHFDKTVRSDIDCDEGYEIVLLDEPGYRRNVSLARLWSHRCFARSFRQWLQAYCRTSKVDLVYSAFPLIATNLFLGQAKRELGFKLVIDVQDVWPESLAVLPMVDRMQALMHPFSLRADRAYAGADALVSVSQTYLQRARRANAKAAGMVCYIGADENLWRSVEARVFDKGKVRFFYLGTVSHSYDMETVVRGFAALASTDPDFELHVIGGGPSMEAVRALAAGNTHFHGYLAVEDMVGLVKGMDVAINPIKSTSRGTITNKLADYVLAGKPILNSQTDDEAMSIIRRVGHRNYQDGNVDDFVRAAREIGRASLPPVDDETARLFDRGHTYSRILDFIAAV